jgi:phage terminase Nu1 subunit (DNA packaging protein)
VSERRWLSGWKQISEYLGVSERTAREYAGRGMPVFKPGGVSAMTTEHDEWVKQQIPADSGKGAESICDPP